MSDPIATSAAAASAAAAPTPSHMATTPSAGGVTSTSPTYSMVRERKKKMLSWENIWWFVRTVLKAPLPLFLVALWATLRLFGVAITINSVMGIILMLSCVVMIVVEFRKSTNLSRKVFRFELYSATIVFAATVVTLYELWRTQHSFFLIDVLVFLMAVADLCVSTDISFCTAMRSWQGNFQAHSGGDHDHDDHGHEDG